MENVNLLQILLAVLALAVPLIIGFIAKPVMSLIKQFMAAVGRLPSIVQQSLVVLIAGAIGLLGNVLQAQLPTDLMLWDAGTVEVLLGAIIAFLRHEAEKRKAVA
jgi:phage-related protein